MPQRPTYYDFFGLSPKASPEQIRSAYLLLMKQHHPDLSVEPDKHRAGHFAAILNRCYDVLKDPAKRARYDAFLASQWRRRPRGPVRRRALLTGQTGPRHEGRWDASSKGAAALACTILLLISAAIWAPAASEVRVSETAAAAVPATDSAAPDETDAVDVDLRNDVRRAMSATAGEAEAESNQCFETAHNAASSFHTEMCVVFDDAYLEWNQANSNSLAQPAYFDERVVRQRHSRAIRAAGMGEGRLDQLRQTALKVLLDEIRSEMEARTIDAPDALAESESPDFAPRMSR